MVVDVDDDGGEDDDATSMVVVAGGGVATDVGRHGGRDLHRHPDTRLSR